MKGPLRPTYPFTGQRTWRCQETQQHSSAYMTLVTDDGTRHVDPHGHLDTRLGSLGELKEAVLAVIHRLACWRLHQVWGNLQTDALAQSAAHKTPRQVADQGECGYQCLSAKHLLFHSNAQPPRHFRNCGNESSKVHQGERPVYRVTMQKRHR